MNRQLDHSKILLTDEDEETGVETEVEVTVYFHVQPAEPDVGIPNEYAEISHVAMDTPLGNILFAPTDWHFEKLQEELGQEIYEGQFDDDGRY